MARFGRKLHDADARITVDSASSRDHFLSWLRSVGVSRKRYQNTTQDPEFRDTRHRLPQNQCSIATVLVVNEWHKRMYNATWRLITAQILC